MNDSTDVPEINTWDGMIDWLVDSFTDKPTGLVIDLGPSGYVVPRDYDEDDDESPVVCAQVHVLADGVLMVRRSRTVLGRLRLDTHAVEGLELDRWFFDGHFDDCTEGYLFTRDVVLAADACVSWFRDSPDAPPLDELGCEYEFPDTLPIGTWPPA
ncbi:hypothetical protein ACWDT5_22135 [Rhodococcus aetherivorans]|uniref:Uncharacterized protein n=1 Tax=Rhodococcus ruber TaxID=1830 RepID=A0A098BV20_9NOCA|nr:MULTISPECIES: hypothetical protein [Rhodococcus]MCD2129412.1 hypothetical protein [Rhodococcus ruber]MCZ1071477.1 hypothetical protein [Rhodococcus sp. A5(2022)]MCZ4505844.1 hypothetical protein [Rhodococcus ruber]MCZ4533044.1 hypothetical protein [Rhodococcus ruber]MCZ4623464.1 hypothetical protein [Rhodococcus ruber]